MKYNNERYALLENGEIEPLYYGDDEEPREFYMEGNDWFLDHDDFQGNCFVRCHHKIIKFLGNGKHMTKNEMEVKITELEKEVKSLNAVVNAMIAFQEVEDDAKELKEKEKTK